MNKKWLQSSIDIDLDNLSKFAATLEDSLEYKQKELIYRVDKEASKLTKEQRDELYEFYEEDHWQLSEIFPNTLRFSLFVTCYSLLEHALVNLCNYLYRQHNYSIELNDLRGEGIFRAQTYLKKVGSVNFPDQTSSWTNIIAYNRIRNFIVHSEGRLDDSDKAKKVESFINTNPSITLDQLKRIQLSKDFCPEVIETLKRFISELFEALP